MPIAAVVADADVLLAAVIGKAALRVFTEHGVAVHVTRFNSDEVAAYIPAMAAKYGLPLELVRLQWRLMSIRVHATAEYRRHLPRARRDLADRDPDDAHTLALARALHLPLWSNDKDLGGHSVECLPTARLLSVLEAR
jgi:predicted nucleic acid-binding protein